MTPRFSRSVAIVALLLLASPAAEAAMPSSAEAPKPFVILYGKDDPLCAAVSKFLSNSSLPDRPATDDEVEFVPWQPLPNYVDKNGAPFWAQPARIRGVRIMGRAQDQNVLVRETGQGAANISNEISIWDQADLPNGHELEALSNPYEPRPLRQRIKVMLALSELAPFLPYHLYFFQKLEPTFRSADDWFHLLRQPPEIMGTGIWYVFRYKGDAFFLVGENSLHFNPYETASTAASDSHTYLVANLQANKLDDRCYLARESSDDPSYGQWINRYAGQTGR
jgi:hypothetical protein